MLRGTSDKYYAGCCGKSNSVISNSSNHNSVISNNSSCTNTHAFVHPFLAGDSCFSENLCIIVVNLLVTILAEFCDLSPNRIAAAAAAAASPPAVVRHL